MPVKAQLDPSRMSDKALLEYAIRQMHRVSANVNSCGDRAAADQMLVHARDALYALMSRQLAQTALFEAKGAYSAE